MISRRSMLRTGALAAAATVGAPAILHAQTKTLKITTWGGKWGDIMKATVLPAFEKEFKCTVSVDQAFPYPPKLQASPKNDPLYDVLHDNSNNQWLALDNGLVMDRITVKEVPNIADVYPYAVSDKIVGVSIFTSAIGLGYRTDKGLTPPTSWKDLADPKLCAIGFRIKNFFTRRNDETSWDYAGHGSPERRFAATRFIGAGHALRRAAFELPAGRSSIAP